MSFIFLNSIEKASEASSQLLEPAIVAAVIAALVTIPSVILNYNIYKLQRLQSERNEIYKKLNDFYGPLRLHLESSLALYKLFHKSITNRLDPNEKFRTLPYILQGKKFNKTEDTLLKQIILLGKKTERIIGENAGLIDDDNLHKEMIKLGTHIRIIRLAYKGEFKKGQGKEILFDDKVFPNEITKKLDTTFFDLKDQLDELNKKRRNKKT